MGNCRSSKVRGKPARILVLGLDSAGKTTLLYRRRLGVTVTTIPTIGFNVETMDPVQGLSFTVWDIGGQTKIRRLWRHYLPSTEGLFYVVDSADKERFEECRDELQNVLNSDQLKGVPVVVLANKQDLPGAASDTEVANMLKLTEHADREWHVQSMCATTGEGLDEGMQAMARLVTDFKKRR